MFVVDILMYDITEIKILQRLKPTLFGVGASSHSLSRKIDKNFLVHVWHMVNDMLDEFKEIFVNHFLESLERKKSQDAI